MDSAKKCSCHHHKILPILLVVFGLSFILGDLHILSGAQVNLIWPSLFVIGGLAKMFSHRCGCCEMPH
jgi:hypothetical protein